MIKAKTNKLRDSEIFENEQKITNEAVKINFTEDTSEEKKLYRKINKYQYQSIDGKIFMDKEDAIKYSVEIEKQEHKLRKLDLYLEKRVKSKNNL